MLKTLWFISKIAILIALAIWIADRPGHVHILWKEYTIDAHLGLALASLFGVLILSLLLYRIIKSITDIPKTLIRNHTRRQEKRGYRALTLGLSAIAAGDAKTASRQAQKTRKLLKESTGLPRLLEAQAAQLNGHKQEAQQHFKQLLNHPDAAFLGLRGLLQSALENDDKAEALTLARQALDKHPKQGWILKITYNLEIEAHDFKSAKKTLKWIERAKIFSKNKTHSDRIAIALYEADNFRKTGYLPQAESRLKEAYGHNKFYVPTVQRLASFYLQNHKRKQAVGILEKAWRQNPHPDLLPLWAEAKPPSYDETDLKILDWYQKLIKLNPKSAYSHKAYAIIAMKHSLWAEARDHLKTALDLNETSEIYKLLATLESKTGQNPEQISDYLEKATTAPAEKQWICTDSFLFYEHWTPFAAPHNSFNTIEWNYPAQQSTHHSGNIIQIPDDEYDLLEAI